MTSPHSSPMGHLPPIPLDSVKRPPPIFKNIADTDLNDFAITPDQLSQIVNFDERTNPEQVKFFNVKYGGVEGLSMLLRTDLQHGLTINEDTPGE